MAGIFWGKSLAYENMPQMPAAVAAKDFRPPSVGIGFPTDGPLDFIVKARPTTMRIKLVFRAEERGIASLTDVYPVRFIVEQDARKWAFRTLMNDNVCLLGRKFIVFDAILHCTDGSYPTYAIYTKK